MNPPLDFQQNPLEFVMDALRVARKATEGPWCWEQCGEKCDSCVVGTAVWKDDKSNSLISGCVEEEYDDSGLTREVIRLESIAEVENHQQDAIFIAKFDPPTVIAILEDWLRLREALTQLAAFDDEGANQRLANTGSYAMFDEPGAVEVARAALAKQG